MNAASHRVFHLLAQAILVTFGVILTADARGDQTITVSGSDTGRTYEGVGAVSGGGATSVLLMDYVEPQRAQILDYLFKPNFGAGMQELYVEIGGDGNSTEGSELSHMHTATDQNYYRGYEWWLMEQAKARNPAILLDATAWSTPYWVGNDNYWSTNVSNDAAGYLANWILGAKSAHGLDINYIGCKNEPNFYAGAAWPELLRTTLNSNRLTSVGIHGLDDPTNGNPPAASMWTWAGAMATDATLNNAFYAVSAHGTAVLPSGGNPPPANIIALNKPLWDTEEHPFNAGFTRATDIVTAFISNYVSGKITKTIYWFLVTAFYQNEPDYDLASPMVAASPWSGAYTVEPALWGYAHISQFTQPGWKFLDNASGNFAGGGNYATLASPNGTDYSVVAQTTTATSTQNITFNVSGGLSTGPISVWSSNATTQFQQQASITPVNGSFSVAMAPNTIYSLTTTTGQGKGAYTPSAASTFPFPYYENYDHYTDFAATGYRAYYHADIAGGFELYARPDGTGNCLRQVVSPPAQSWAPEWNPYTIVGDTTWKNYQVSADVSIQTTGNTTGWASIMGRVNSTGDGYGTTPSGYYMTLTTTGAWTFNKSAFSGATAITHGQATLASGGWHNLQLVFQGTSIEGLVDGTQVFTVTDATYGQGSVGLGTEGGTNALFDNLIVNTVGGGTVAPTVFPQDGENAADGGARSDAGGSAIDAGGKVGTTPDGGRVADSGAATGGRVAEGGGTLDGSGGSSGNGEANSTAGSSNGGAGSSGGCACHVSEIRADEGEAGRLLIAGSVLLAAGRRRRGRKASVGEESRRVSSLPHHWRTFMRDPSVRHAVSAVSLLAAACSGLACSQNDHGSPDEGDQDASVTAESGERSDSDSNADSGAAIDSNEDAATTAESGTDGSIATDGGHYAAGSDGGHDPATTDASAANPFNCKFAWGEPVPGGSLTSYTWLEFMTSWAGYEIQANGSISSFDNGGFLSSMAATQMIGVYYAYLIGYYGHANNLPDGNLAAAGQPNLTTGAAYLLLSDPTGANAPCHSTTDFCADNLIIQAYAYYAKETHAAWPTKPFIWLIEGDYIQYTDTSQVASLTSTTGPSAALSYAQLGQLAALITTAIKSNMPNAVVAFDDSAWISDVDRPLYWTGIKQANYDMVWTTGVGNNPPFVNAGETASSYDGMTGTYSWLHSYTGKKILVDESAGASQQADTWSDQSATTINSLIADGVIAVNVSGAPSTYQANVTALDPNLTSTCP